MTPEENKARLENLEKRVDRHEELYRDDVILIHQKLDALTAALNAVLVASARKPECPAPGSCVILGEQFKASLVTLNATTLRVERLELRMLDFEKWQSRLIGGVSVMMVLLTLFGPTIRKIFKLE